jgi:hypothetical protein
MHTKAAGHYGMAYNLAHKLEKGMVLKSWRGINSEGAQGDEREIRDISQRLVVATARILFIVIHTRH